MTAAPELRSRLALVHFYPSFPVVAATRRSGTVTRRNVLGSPDHYVSDHRYTRPTGITNLCPQTET